MKTQKLKIGQSFPNYPKLCDFLEMPRLSSNSKKAQLKELQRYCKLQQVGHSFTVKEIYDFPSLRVENRGRNTIYGDLVQLLITDYLIDSGKLTNIITRKRLMNHINMINNNYTFGSENVPRLSKYTQIDEGIIYDFLDTTDNNFRSAIETALRNLRNRSLVMYDTITIVCIDNKQHRVAEEHEKDIILSSEIIALNELGYTEIKDVIISGAWEAFAKRVKELLKEKSDISYYYSSYEITINKDYIVREHNSLLSLTLDQIERQNRKDELNKIIGKRLLKNAKRRNESNSKNIRKREIRESSTYISDSQKLIDILIDSDAKNLQEGIENNSQEK